MIRREFALKMLAATAAVSMSSVQAQDAFPNKPLWIIVPWPAGAGTDVATRAVAEALSRELGQPVQVDNKPGASGAIGSTYVAKAPADGYTLVTATADTHSINPHVRTNLPYDAANGFEPLALFAKISWVWITRPNFGPNNLKEFIALAKQKPEGISYGSWGIGSTGHLAGALLESAAGIQLKHVPHQGAAPAMTSLLGGHIDVLPFAKPQAADLRAQGKAKILGIASAQRSTDLITDVPTLAEGGLQGAEAGSWYAIMAPKGIPEAVRNRLSAALVKVLSTPDMAARIRATGLDPVVMHGPALAEFVRQEYQRYGAIVKQKNITAN